MNRAILKEVTYKTSRSSGPGGQHVNRTESKVELHWNIGESTAVPDEKKAILSRRLKSRITAGGDLILTSQRYRSQIRNREDVTERFLKMIERFSVPQKKRVKTRPTRASEEKRLKAKKELSEKKKRRKL